ncbi:hypothetical protein GBP346_B1971 [Burkholderia pseudomallei MSHR346]|nr:hypothetical protein GBP346_B1971 [Burkholderia pseudomallei MSHR346]
MTNAFARTATTQKRKHENDERRFARRAAQPPRRRGALHVYMKTAGIDCSPPSRKRR